MEFLLQNMANILLGILTVMVVIFAILFVKDFMAHKDELEPESQWPHCTAIGFITNFFDTLGIGSFAPTTALLKFFKQSRDKVIPGVLNVGCCIPVVMEALIFINKVEVEPITLGGMLFAAAIGAYFGAGIISNISEQAIRLIMAIALIVTAFLMVAGIMEWMPVGGEANGLEGGKLIFAIAANFVLGAFMTAGVGLYAPCMALVFILGMSPLMAFPLMMGSCAILMPVASYRFIKEGAYNRKASMAITLGGIVGVLIAAYIVTSLPLAVLKWLVVVVVLYTALAMLRSYMQDKSKAEGGETSPSAPADGGPSA